MDSQRWQRMEELFSTALTLSVEERDKYLTQACGDDDSLRMEVEALLRADTEATKRIGGAIAETLEHAAVQEPEQPQNIGPYQVLERIGEGGLSRVFLAERADRQYRMKVAIKLVKRGMDTEDILRRLRQERQILANLKHPHIAQLLDGGTTDDGLPYFVMEYIDGEPIDEYCDHRHLDLRQRLELFQTACSAVHYAHQSLVIHRDLKPSNIMVADDGGVKLLDFGIAKLLKSGQTDMTLARTMTGLRLLTPSYASPEQIRGLPLTTATDVYSLGVMLYELLTGLKPFDTQQVGVRELEEIICSQDPLRPSEKVWRDPRAVVAAAARRSSPDRLQRRLKGDLDNIILMAMRKEKERRYSSVQQMAEDIERHLADQPVRARKDTAFYRAGKFVQRHRGGVVAATLLATSLGAGVGSTFHQTQVANSERAKAELALAESREVTAFLIDLFKVSDPEVAGGEQISAREILDQGALNIRQRLSAQPLVQARMMSVMGLVYHGLGMFEEGRTLFAEVVEKRREILGPSDSLVAQSLNELSGSLFSLGHYEEAGAKLEEALAIYESVYGTATDHREIAETLHRKASVLEALGRSQEAFALLQEALAMRRRVLGEEHLEVAESLNELGEFYFARQELQEAEELFRQALKIREQQLTEVNLDLVTSLNNMGVVLEAQGKFQEAEKIFRRVLELRQSLQFGEHSEIALVLNNLGTVLSVQNRSEEAEVLLREGLAMSRRLLGDEHRQVASLLNNLADCMVALNRPQEAEDSYQESLRIKRKIFGDRHVAVTKSLFNLALFYINRGGSEKAIPLLEEAIESQRSDPQLSADDYRRSYPLMLLGRVWVEAGDCGRAMPLLHDALEIRRSNADPEGITQIEEILGQCRDGAASPELPDVGASAPGLP